MEVLLILGNLPVSALVDTGASRTFVKANVLPQLPLRPDVRRCNVPVVLADGKQLQVKHEAFLSFRMGSLSSQFPFLVLETLTSPVILGLDFMIRFALSPVPCKGVLSLEDGSAVPFLPCALWPTRLRDSALRLETLSPPPVKVDPKRTPTERAAILALLQPKFFASKQFPLGKATCAVHTIDTGRAYPIAQRLRPTSPLDRETIRSQVQEMLACGAIRPSQSPWASPVVLVSKKDGDTRFCIDYRKLNDVTIKDAHPLPRIVDMLESLRGARYFTTLDAAKGYWQIPMDVSSIEKTAFSCSEGLFEFLVMPFGLCNAPATYQRAMQGILAGLIGHGCLVYIDDILIYSRTFDDHLALLRTVLTRCFDAGILLKADKCDFGKEETEYLGHVISSEGVRQDPKKMDKLRNYPVPTDKRTVRAFLGLASYYRRFVRDFSRIAAPLHELTKADTTFEWTPQTSEAFTRLKEVLTANILLPFPDFASPFIIDCDASDVGMGAVLSQHLQGVERPISLESRKFTDAERKWHIREKEALAILYGLTKFRRFILGCQFTVRTDHQSLEWLFNAKSGRLCRWALTMSEYLPFQIQHRKGRMHANVDALTRDFAESEALPDHATLCSILLDLAAPGPILFPSVDLLRRAQENDKQCQRVIAVKRATFREKVAGIGRKDSWRPLLPSSLVEGVARSYHGHPLGAHLGARRLMSALSKHYIITNGLQEVQKVTNGCLKCQQRKPTLQKAGKYAAKPPSSPWKTVAVDFAGPLITSSNGSKYILVFMDQFTKWVELVPTRDQLASTVVQAFYSNVICRHGCPEYLLSDRGPQFSSALVDTMCVHFGIKKIFSSAYYPQGDGFAERFMRTMNNSLSALSREDPQRWHTYLPGLAFAYNSSAHAATRVSPFELNTGRVPSLPGGRNLARGCADEVTYLKRLRNVITNALQRSRQAVQGYWENVKRQYDKHRRDVQLKPGDLVLVRLSDYERKAYPCLKLAPRWSEIQTVEKQLSNGVTYRVTRADGKTESVHVSRLLPLRDPVWNGVSVGTPLITAAQESSSRPTAGPNCDPREAQEGSATDDQPIVYYIDDEPTRDTPLNEAAQDHHPRTDAAQGGVPREVSEGSLEETAPAVTTTTAVELSPGFLPVERIVAKRADPVHGYLYRVRWKGFKPRDDTWQCRDDFPTSLLIDEFDNSVREKRSSTRGDVVAPSKSPS